MKLCFEPVTSANRAEAEALRLLPGQEHMIESVSECLAEADADPRWRPVAILDGPRMVGFAMYGRFEEYRPEPRVWLDRLLIDRSAQGRGCGRAAVQALTERLYAEYHTDRLYLSVYEDNLPAIRLYRQLGFQFNGERDINGERVMCRSAYAARPDGD